MKSRIRHFGSLLLCIILICLTVWLSWPYFLLRSAEHRLNHVYSSNRPFIYRWLDAPYSPLSAKAIYDKPQSIAEIEKAQEEIQRAESIRGQSTRTLQLRGRADLLMGRYTNAVDKYRLASILEPGNATLQLELSIALSLAAAIKGNVLDYEFALEASINASQQIHASELSFNTAELLEEIHLKYQAIDEWAIAEKSEMSQDWRKEAEERRGVLAHSLDLRERLTSDLTGSPELYLAHQTEARESLELVVGTALEDWLPNTYHSPITRKALSLLAKTLMEQHGDHWLFDLLSSPYSPGTEKAFRLLSAAWRANLRGSHVEAEKLASDAERLFWSVGNSSGALRSRMERIYSFDRRVRSDECLRDLIAILPTADHLQYVWIAGQARLEEITCLTQKRNTEVIELREKAYTWIAKTHYQGLYLRALGFLTENYASLGNRSRIWGYGLDGTRAFWSVPLSPLRGYSFYFTMASSARTAGNLKAAIVLLRESIRVLEHSSYLQLRGLLLADLGEWEVEAGSNSAAVATFEEVSRIFAHLNKTETQDIQNETEILRAGAATAAGRPAMGLSLLKHLTSGMAFPYHDLNPNVRRRLFPVFGDTLLATGKVDEASLFYLQAIAECQEHLKTISNRVQRDNALREMESAWRGLTETSLRDGDFERALNTWESFRDGRLRKPSPIRIQPPEGITLVVYTLLPSGLSGWAVNGNGIEHQWIDRSASRLAKQFSAIVASRESSLEDVSAIARRLYRLLIKPFARLLPAKGMLIIDADGPLAAIPWLALEDSKGQALVERFAISQSLGWTEASSRLQKESVDFSAPLIVGEPALGQEMRDEYPNLLETANEADELHRRLKHGWFFEGDNATVDALLSNLSAATVFHFAGHGISYGEFGALLLASSNKESQSAAPLTANMIARLKMQNLQLVVLAACSSGVGEQHGVVNLDSLVRAFLEAGALRVVAARWNVDSAQTANLMSKFYDATLDGIRPSEALREAAAQIRHNTPTAHPFFWSSFQVFGTP